MYFLKYKSQTFENSKKFKLLVEKQSGYFIRVLCIDRGEEFLSIEFKDFCDDHGMHRKLTVPYTAEQNGVSKRKNQNVVIWPGVY